MRLHHRVGVIGRRVGGVELQRRGGEGAVEVANLRLRRAADRRRLGERRRVLRGSEIEPAGSALVLHPHELRRRARLLERVGHHQGDRLVIVIDRRSAEKLGDVVLALAKPAGAACRDNGSHAWRDACGPDVE